MKSNCKCSVNCKYWWGCYWCRIMTIKYLTPYEVSMHPPCPEIVSPEVAISGACQDLMVRHLNGGTWRGSSFLLLQSQILTALSVDPDNITEESSLYFTQFTVPACPLYFRSILPVPTSVAHTYLSIPQEQIWLLSQEAWASRTS